MNNVAVDASHASNMIDPFIQMAAVEDYSCQNISFESDCLLCSAQVTVNAKYHREVIFTHQPLYQKRKCEVKSARCVFVFYPLHWHFHFLYDFHSLVIFHTTNSHSIQYQVFRHQILDYPYYSLFITEYFQLELSVHVSEEETQ